LTPPGPALSISGQIRSAAAGRAVEVKEKSFILKNPRQSGGVRTLAEIKVQEGESIENALRRFKRKVQQEDIIKDIKKHSFYLKPGDKRRAKQALARKRNRKKIRREME
jgi:small subunit ribosomal protein S21